MSVQVSYRINYDSMSSHLALLQQATAKFSSNRIVSLYAQITINTSLQDFIKELETLLNAKALRISVPQSSYLMLEFNDLVILLNVKSDIQETRERSLLPTIRGDMEKACALVNLLEKTYPRKKNHSLTWYYAIEDKKFDSTDITLEDKNAPHDAFFPWIKPDILSYQKEFLKSDANVLLLIGPPGTGKTSFLRSLIKNNDLQTVITYDEALLRMDSFFVEFMKRKDDVFIIEDADTILHDRLEGNKLMNKILNVSDGLITTKKKIIFTANITQLDEVDPALLRPGRCFDVLHFRELNRLEANAAARAAGIPEPDEAKTLAQLFSTRPDTTIPSRLGFSMP